MANTLLKIFRIFSVGGGNGGGTPAPGTAITVVANYSALPAAATVPDEFYWCEASQGTAWLPGSLGGTYYSAGLYYSNGVAWQYMDVPYQATQVEVDAGVNTDHYITPKTLKDAAQWNQKANTNAVVNSINASTGPFNLTVGSSLSFSTAANNITFGLASNITTALQSAGNYLTTAAQSNQVINSINGSVGTFSFNTGSSLSSSRVGNAITWGLASNITTALQSAGNYLTTAALSNHSHNFATTTTNGAVIVVGTTNSNGATIGVPAFLTTAQAPGAYLTTAAQSNHSHGNPTLALTNINGTTASASNGLTLSLSAVIPAQTVQPVAISGSNGSFNFSTLSFGNLNGLSFYTSNGSIVGSYTDAGAGAGISAINISAGTTSNNLTNFVFNDANGVSFGLNGSTVTASVNAGGGGATKSTYIPYYPASTGAQTIGAQGVTSASAWFFPISIQDAVRFNQIEQLMTASWVSSSVAFSHTVTHHFGIFSNNAGTLSVISSSSYSVAATGSTVSATLSYPSAYGTAGGYTYTTVGASSTATAQSLFGTAGNRIMTFGFGNTMELSAGLYWLGIHARQSSSSANGGMAFALGGNVMVAVQNVGRLGSSTAAFTGTNNTLVKIPWGVATSTGSAGYGGSRLPDAVNITAMGMTASQRPMMTFISR